MDISNQKEGILMKKNFYLDLLLFVSGLVCLITGIVLDFHLFGGFGAAAPSRASSQTSTPTAVTS